MAMTPAQAANVLRNSPGFSSVLNNPEIQGADLMDQRHGEAIDQLASSLGIGDARDAARQKAYLGDIESTQAEDPYSVPNSFKRTGVDLAATQKANEAMDPTAVAARTQLAEEAVKQAGAVSQATGMGKAAADVSPDAQMAAGLASTRKIAEEVAPTEALFNGGGGSAGFAYPSGGSNAIDTLAAASNANPNLKIDPKLAAVVDIRRAQLGPMTPKLSNRADQTMMSIRELAPLIGQLSGMLDPSDNSLTSKIGNEFKYGLYHMGMSPSFIPGVSQQDQLRMQLAGLIKVLGSSPYASASRNFQFLKQAQEHLTDPAATPAFLASQLEEMKQILPMFQHEILTQEGNPSAPLNWSMPGQGGSSKPGDSLGIRD